MSTALVDDELRALLALARDSDSAELKLTVPEEQHRSTIAGLGMDPLDAQIRLVSFFDTPDLALNRAGVVVRARRVQGRGDDSVVKLRPVVPDELERSPGLFVEVDAMPGGYVCSASMKARLGSNDVRRVVAGERAIRKLFTKDQRAFYAAHAPAGVELDELSTKCAPSEMFQVAAETRAFLAGRGVDVSGAQQTKTATALSFFAQHLRSD
jgi:hypothetical protein